MITHEQCLYWDQEDELKKFKDEFALPENVIYLDGNFGCKTKKSLEVAQHIIAKEGEDLINS